MTAVNAKRRGAQLLRLFSLLNITQLINDCRTASMLKKRTYNTSTTCVQLFNYCVLHRISQ